MRTTFNLRHRDNGHDDGGVGMTTISEAVRSIREFGAGFVEYKFRDDNDTLTTYVVVAVDEDARELVEVIGEWAERREAETEGRA